MRLQVNGIEYTEFVEANTVLRLDALTNTFGFEATSDEARPLPFLGGEACKVSVDGEQVLSGFIELVNVDGEGSDPPSHQIDIQGRDRTGDFLDSSITGKLSDITGNISLKRVIEAVILHLDSSSTRLKVIDNANPDRFNAGEDLQAPEPGDNAFDFVESLARKRQVILTSNADGDIVIQAGAGVAAPGAFIQNQVASNDNNVLRYSLSLDTPGRFNRYFPVAQLNTSTLFSGFSGPAGAASIVDQGGTIPATDSEIRQGRQMVLIAENPSSDGQGEKRSAWERDIRRARGKVYSATVQGFRDPAGNLWKINTLVPVLDDYAGIESTMLVNSVTYKMGPEGRTTTLSFIEADAYTLSLAEPLKAEKVGSGLFAGVVAPGSGS